MAHKIDQRGYTATKISQSAILNDAIEPTEEVKKKEEIPKTTSTRTSIGGERKPTEKAATGGEIIKNAVYSGLSQFNKGLASTLDFLLPTEFLGEYDPVSRLNDYYSGQADKYSAALEESTADRSKAVQLGAQTLANATAAVPNAALAVLSGGSSAAAQGTTSALTAASSAAQSSGMLSTAAAAAQGMVKNPLFWSSVGQTLGINYEDAKAKGANEWQAIGSAYTSSMLNAAVEAGGGLETLPNVLKRGSVGPATAWARSALTEGFEEPVQSAVSGLSEKLFYDRDKPLFSRTDPTAVINPERMGQEFAMGTAVGGILGTGQLAGSNLADTASMKLARRGDYSGFVRELDGLIRQKKLDELMAEYEKHTDTSPVHLQETVENIGKDDMITSFQIGKSVGASAKNYPVKLPDNNQHVKFAEGQEIEGKAFAGKGTDKEIRDRFRLETTYRIPTHEWQKMSGNAYVVIDGKRKKAEIHWYSAKGKNVEMKVKRYFDED